MFKMVWICCPQNPSASQNHAYQPSIMPISHHDHKPSYMMPICHQTPLPPLTSAPLPLPMNINNRLSRLSANEDVFNEAAPPYQQALIDSGYEHILKFQPNIRSIDRKRNRNRKCIWFNPPWSSNVKSNIGAQFLRIISECFSRGHILHKVFNRNNVKVSYRTMDNVRKIVSRHSNKIMNNQNPPQPPPPCRCRVLSPLCPNQCKTKDVIYMCRVAPPNNQDVETYTGLTSQTFKKRWDQHMSDCRKGEGTTLASHIGELKAKGIDVDLLTHLH